MTATMIRPIAETNVISLVDEETDPGKCAHIVKTKPGESAAGLVLEARVMGFTVEALCGYKWIPSQDPEKLPVCQKCKDEYDKYREFNDELNERPAA
jgi:hypothetical protein